MTPSAQTLRRWIALACTLALAVGTLAACGGDDDSSASGGSSTAAPPTSGYGGYGGGGGGEGAASTSLDIGATEADGSLGFTRRAVTAGSGSVRVTLDNPSGNQLPHAIEIEGSGVEEETATIEPGRRTSVTVDLRPGRYTFYCPVGDHRAAGMEGTLTVG